MLDRCSRTEPSLFAIDEVVVLAAASTDRQGKEHASVVESIAALHGEVALLARFQRCVHRGHRTRTTGANGTANGLGWSRSGAVMIRSRAASTSVLLKTRCLGELQSATRQFQRLASHECVIVKVEAKLLLDPGCERVTLELVQCGRRLRLNGGAQIGGTGWRIDRAFPFERLVDGLGRW